MDFKVLGQLISSISIVVVQSLSRVWLFATSCTAAHRTGFPVLHYLPEFAQTHVRWVNAAIQPSPFSPCLQFFPASGSFPMSQLFASDSQSIGASALAPVLPLNIQDWFPLGLTGWLSFQSKGLSRAFSSTTVWKHQFFSAQSNCDIHTWLLEKP